MYFIQMLNSFYPAHTFHSHTIEIQIKLPYSNITFKAIALIRSNSHQVCISIRIHNFVSVVDSIWMHFLQLKKNRNDESNKNSIDLTIFQFLVKFITLTQTNLYSFFFCFFFPLSYSHLQPLFFRVPR